MDYNKLIKSVFMKFSLLMVAGMLGQACAAKKLVVKNGDTLLKSKIEKVLPLRPEQEKELASDVDNFLNQSKKRVPEVKKLLDSIDLTRHEEVDAFYKKISDLYKDIAYDFNRILSKHMARFDETQQKKFFLKLEEDNKKLAQKDSSTRLKGQEKNLEYVLGQLTDEQKKLIQDHKDLFDSLHAKKLERRKNLHEQFKETYKLSEKEREEKFLKTYENFQTESLKEQGYLPYLKKLVPTLTKDQIKHAGTQVEEIKEVLDYFVEVSY